MAISTRPRRRLAPRRPAPASLPARPPFGPRLVGALRRRVAYAWSRWTLGNRLPSAEAALEWLLRAGGSGWVPAAAGASAGCPAATGGAIETVLRFGAAEPGRAWARWLMSLQHDDGWIGEETLDTPSALNTAQLVRGLLAIEPEMPEVEPAVLEACRYLVSQIDETGRMHSSEEPAALLACLPPLLHAGRRYSQADWQSAVVRAATFYRDTVDFADRQVPAYVRAWQAEALFDLGSGAAAAELLRPVEDLQLRDGSVPAVPGGRWVSSAALAHLAVCWYKLAQRDRADRAMQCLARQQGHSGGFRSCFGPGRRRHGHAEVAWTAKLYLDAALLQVRAAFDADAASAPDGSAVPEWIDPADGRVQAVRRWMASLPGDARVADVGCGRGRYLRHLCDWFAGAELTGIDVSPAMLEHLPQQVDALQGSLLRVPAADGSFDGAFAVESLEHALLPKRAVAELCRIVRPGGRVLIVDKHRAHQALSQHEPWEQWFTADELVEWLQPYCDEVAVSHLEGQPDNDLFLAVSGVRNPL